MSHEKLESDDARLILGQLRELRYCHEAEANFWALFLSSVSKLCHATIAMVVCKDEDQQAWLMTSFCGSKEEKDTYMGSLMQSAASLATRVESNSFAFERAGFRIAAMRQPVVVALSLQTGTDDKESLLILLLDRAQVQNFNETLVRTQLVSDIPASYFAKRSFSGDVAASNDRHLSDVLEVMGMVIHQRKFLLACMTLVNELSSRFSCSQVSIGWEKTDYIKTIAISHLERIEKNTDAVQELETLFEESCDQDEEILYPDIDSEDFISVAHQKYAHARDVKQIFSLPIRVEGSPLAVIVCEKIEGKFSDSELLTLRLLSNQLTPWLNEIYKRDRWFGSRLSLKCKEHLAWWLGVEHTWIKLSAIVFSGLLLYTVFASWLYRVEASASLATDHLAYLSAPFNGYVDTVNVHSGDEVKKEDIILTFDKEELFLKSSEVEADILRFSSESEKARAARSFADMRIAEARLEQAKAELERVHYYIKQSEIVAPFDGVIVEGEKEQLLGSPLNKGDLIFKIAQLEGLYVTLRVAEQDIDDIHVGQFADLVLLSRPGLHIPLQIQKIIPVANVQEGEGNVFSVKAVFTGDAEPWWRPGMSGVVKVDVGERSVLWILSHRSTDFLKMYFWW